MLVLGKDYTRKFQVSLIRLASEDYMRPDISNQLSIVARARLLAAYGDTADPTSCLLGFSMARIPQPEGDELLQFSGRKFSRFSLEHNVYGIPIDQVRGFEST